MLKATHGRMQLHDLASGGVLHMVCPRGLSPLGSLAVNSPVGAPSPAPLCLGARVAWESTFPSLSGGSWLPSSVSGSMPGPGCAFAQGPGLLRGGSVRLGSLFASLPRASS